MILKETPLAGLWEVWPEIRRDERGFFARTSCLEEFEAAGLPADWTLSAVSWNARLGTLRGLHYQTEPFGEHKLVRCTRGRAFDVALDLRRGSPSHGRWHGLELTAENRAALYIPPGLAHGFLTLTDEVEIFYQIKGAYRPEAARGVRWDDPAFGLDWPGPPRVISPADAAWPYFEDPAREGL
ncbi:MAG: dTDP-4-dehydrorhamnose 3,5-epimerase family protein [Candidatus Adiutrix sp.]|jgi:dTDP-4-dehydrorhamnose 3,5-epimerase|nr:dTDP-4-dehydrorhamnose 3,5-epimerase family protein [Candidatus Adiutrix sp.]